MSLQKKTLKFVIIGAGFALVIVSIFFIFFNKPQEDVLNASPVKTYKEVLQELETLEFKNPDLTAEQKEKYFDEFKKAREELRGAVQKIEEKKKGAEVLLYQPLLIIGGVQRDSGNFEKAEKAFLLAHKIQPGAFPPLSFLAELYFRYLKDYQKSAQSYLKAIEVIGDDANFQIYIEQYYGEVYNIYRFQMSNQKKAEDLLISAIEKYPKYDGLLAQLALHYRQIGEKEKAIEAYKKLLDLKPDSVVAKQGLEELK